MENNIWDYYNTPLGLKETAQYLMDKSLSPWRNDSGYDYDLQGYWKANRSFPSTTFHLPDTYKKPSHPTFSNESIYYTGQPWAIDWMSNPWVTLSNMGIF